MNNEALLNKVIEYLLNKVENTEDGSEQQKALVDAIAKLEDKALEIQRIKNDAADKAATRERDLKNDIIEHNLKCEQMSEERIGRWVKDILTALGIVLPICVAVWGTKVSFKFEEEGTITTIGGRSWITGLFRLGKK
jgi:hypothetical protein